MQAWLESGQAVLIDVREPDEHAREAARPASWPADCRRANGRDRKAPLPLMRQVQIAPGSLVLLGTGLAVLASPGSL